MVPVKKISCTENLVPVTRSACNRLYKNFITIKFRVRGLN
jgi:hypothetical protein